MKQLLAKPGFLAQTGTVGADISYILAVVFTALFLYAWFLAKKGLGTKHHNLIFISMLAMVIYFCAYYLARQLGVLSLEGKEGFGGPAEVYDNVFVPILTTHLILVTTGLILAFYMVIEGFRASEKTNGVYVLKEGNLLLSPKKFKTIMFVILGLWLANQFVLSFVRHASTGASIAWAIIFATIAFIISIEKGIEKLLPDGARRHKVLGRGTMIVYALTLLTSTLTYLLLYVIYPVKH